MTSEAFGRARIDAPVAAQGWNTRDRTAVRHEAVLPDRATPGFPDSLDEVIAGPGDPAWQDRCS
ncbi:MAG: hypothetical protein ACKOGH_16575 [Alphaproteobacteria bacterium]